VQLVEAVEAFWMDFAPLPKSDSGTLENRQSAHSTGQNTTHDAPPGDDTRSGPPIAFGSAEARSQAMEKETATPPRKAGCDVHNGLLDDFGMAIRELLELHEQQFLAIVDGDIDCHRFDLLIHMANEKKQLAKYAYLRHVEEHGCSNLNVNQART
jgi:hypothetical protein